MQAKTIIITGCSTGIGYDAAHTLAQRGHHVIASCRKIADVEKLSSQGLETVLLDVSNPQSIAKAFPEILAKADGHIDILLNNAGYGQAGALEDVSYEVMQRQFATNVFGLMELTRLVIPLMRQQKQGRIINISSVLGLISLPFRGAYNASKYAVEGLSDTLRLELKPSGIDVITIEPGPIESKFRDNVLDSSLKNIDMEHSHFHEQYQKMLGEFRQHKTESIFTKGTEAVVKKIIHACESKAPKAKYPVTFPSYFFSILKRVLTVKMLDRVLNTISKKELG